MLIEEPQSKNSSPTLVCIILYRKKLDVEKYKGSDINGCQRWLLMSIEPY